MTFAQAFTVGVGVTLGVVAVLTLFAILSALTEGANKK